MCQSVIFLVKCLYVVSTIPSFSGSTITQSDRDGPCCGQCTLRGLNTNPPRHRKHAYHLSRSGLPQTFQQDVLLVQLFSTGRVVVSTSGIYNNLEFVMPTHNRHTIETSVIGVNGHNRHIRTCAGYREIYCLTRQIQLYKRFNFDQTHIFTSTASHETYRLIKCDIPIYICYAILQAIAIVSLKQD